MSVFDNLALRIGQFWFMACNPAIVISFLFCLLVTLLLQYRIYTYALPALGKAAAGKHPVPEVQKKIASLLTRCFQWRDLMEILIPLFPQAGIMGTVSALLLELSVSGGVGTGSDNIRFAMTSTLYGLLAAIILSIAHVALKQNLDHVEIEWSNSNVRKGV